MRDPSRVRMSGPLEPFAAGFAAELQRQGYTPNSTCLQMQLMAHLSRWLAAEDLDGGALDAATVGAFVAARRQAGYLLHRTPRALAPLLGQLRTAGAAPPVAPAPAPASALEQLLDRYRRYLTLERGLAKGTVRDYLDAVRPFLASQVGAEGLDLQRLAAADVTAFVVAACPKRSVGSAKLIVTALRSLLGFLHIEGMIGESLVGAVPAVAGWRLAGLPRALDPADVRRMLAGCDRRTSLGRRDFAVLTLLARLALRKGEVAALGLDDVDWRASEIVVCGKGSRSERLPLPTDVGEAIAAYLRCGRPQSAEGRSLFVRHKAPHTAMSAGAVGHVVAAAARRAGLGTIGAHRLRHTAATEMLRAGSSLAEVGEVLRHRSAHTTAIYAKVDREALRSIARCWPGAGS